MTTERTTDGLTMASTAYLALKAGQQSANSSIGLIDDFIVVFYSR